MKACYKKSPHDTKCNGGAQVNPLRQSMACKINSTITLTKGTCQDYSNCTNHTHIKTSYDNYMLLKIRDIKQHADESSTSSKRPQHAREFQHCRSLIPIYAPTCAVSTTLHFLVYVGYNIIEWSHNFFTRFSTSNYFGAQFTWQKSHKYKFQPSSSVNIHHTIQIRNRYFG